VIAIVTVLLAFPLGYLVRSRLVAGTTYAVAYLWAFVFQTLYLTLDSLDRGRAVRDEGAFAVDEFPWEYGVVALLVLGAGFTLLNLGHWVATRRAAKRVRGSAPV